MLCEFVRALERAQHIRCATQNLDRAFLQPAPFAPWSWRQGDRAKFSNMRTEVDWERNVCILLSDINIMTPNAALIFFTITSSNTPIAASTPISTCLTKSNQLKGMKIIYSIFCI